MKSYLHWDSLLNITDTLNKGIPLKIVGIKDILTYHGIITCPIPISNSCKMRWWCDRKRMIVGDMYGGKRTECKKYFLADKTQAILIDETKSMLPNNMPMVITSYEFEHQFDCVGIKSSQTRTTYTLPPLNGVIHRPVTPTMKKFILVNGVGFRDCTNTVCELSNICHRTLIFRGEFTLCPTTGIIDGSPACTFLPNHYYTPWSISMLKSAIM